MNQKRSIQSSPWKLNLLEYFHQLWRSNQNFLVQADAKLTKRQEKNQSTEFRFTYQFAKPYIDHVFGVIREVDFLIGKETRLVTREIF